MGRCRYFFRGAAFMAKIVDHSDKLLKLVDDHIQDSLEKSAQVVEGIARDTVRLRTGATRDSHQHEVEGKTAIIGADTPYAHILEFRYAWLRKALIQSFPQIRTIFTRHIKKR